MKRSLVGLAPAVVAIAIAGCGGGSSSHSGNGTAAQPGANSAAATPSASATVAARNTKLGRILVDARGRSLYLFEQDKGTASTCYGACASLWPPLTVSGNPNGSAAIVGSKLGTTKRKDGKAEVTYNGHPLYYYAGDQKPGDTTGEGLNQFGAPWDVLSTSGKGIDGD
jgi:predicted lipoprotein with Yx(FWY)xxD motif